jgi:hypothetical protein
MVIRSTQRSGHRHEPIPLHRGDARSGESLTDGSAAVMATYLPRRMDELGLYLKVNPSRSD